MSNTNKEEYHYKQCALMVFALEEEKAKSVYTSLESVNDDELPIQIDRSYVPPFVGELV